VKAAVAAAKGETVAKRIDTGTFLVTPETSAEYKKLIGM
jgi:ABC-type sugar transport system substrate-binding protein